MRQLPVTSLVSLRAALMTHGSALALGCAVAGAIAAPAYAQDRPNPPTPAQASNAPEGQQDVQPSSDPAAQAVPPPVAVPQPVQDAASDAATDTADPDVVVTGIRASLDSAARTKRNTVNIIESVSAEDIGKLPDVSIADSLARLPGVTAQRLEGRDQNLSIRGLGPDFSTTLLNGREQVTTGDNRGVEYDQYPSEFFQSVNVYKSADAALVAAGISGTVDLRMLRPLDQNKRIVALQLRGEMDGLHKLNPDGKRYGFRTSATYIDQFADDTLGIAIGVSGTRAPTQDERYNAWGYANDADGNLILGGAKPYVQSDVLDRYGAVATVEWRPSDRFHSTFDALYSHFRDEQHLRGIEFPLAFNGSVVASGITAEDGFDTATTFSNVHAVQRNDYNLRTAEEYSLGWNNVLDLNDHLHFTVDASVSHAERTDFLLENYSGTGYNLSGPADTITVSQNGNYTFDLQSAQNYYTDLSVINITDPQGWGYNGTQPVVQAGFLNRPKFKDDLKSLRADLAGEFEGSVVKGWQVGANYSRREKDARYTSYFLCPKTGNTNCTVSAGTATSEPIPADALLGNNVSLAYLNGPSIIAYDPLYAYDNFYNAAFDGRPDSLVRDNTVTENVYTGYAKLLIDGLVGGKTLRGSLGAQVVRTRQSSTGQIASLNNGIVTVAPASQSETYTDFLPSATMSLELEPGFFLKAGASETMVRPRLDQERVTQAVSINIANIGLTPSTLYPVFSSNGGNVNLKPYHSTNIDLSLEHYFRDGGYVSLAGYFKHLTDFVDPNNSYAYDFSSLLSALTPAQQAQVLATNATTGVVSAPANTGRGELLGVEATASLPFKTLTSALDGFGIFATGSYTHSAIRYASNPQTITLPGLSAWVASGEAYFEKYGFQARVSYRYRGKFLGEVAGLSASPTFRQAKAEGILDAQIGYDFSSGFLKGFSILAQAKNLTDRPFITYQNNDERQVIDYQRYGRDYYLGIAYKF